MADLNVRRRRAVRALGASVAVGVALGLAGCGSGAGEDAAAVTSPDQLPTTAEGAERCLPASEAAVAAITDGLEAGTTLVEPYIVRSRDYNRAYFVSGRVEGAPGGEQLATWAVTDPEPSGTLVFAVTEPAKRLSSFSDAGGSFSGTDDGVGVSQECASAESLSE